MIVWADGGQAGSVGGGRIEQETVEVAREVARGGAPVRLDRHLVHELGMCCCGKMSIAIGPAARSRGAMASVIEAARARTWIVVETPGDGGAMTARPPRGDERVSLARPRASAAGGPLCELFGPPERAIVFGCGHVGNALGPMLASLGFAVIIADDADTGAVDCDDPPPWASHVVESFDVADVERAIGRLGAGDHVFIVTRDHAIDQRILESILGNDQLSYLGLIGSRGKVGRFEKRLRAKGAFDEAGWARLRAPIGLDLGSETPAEIAVAVAAELVALRRRGAATAGPRDPARARAAAEDDGT